MKLYDALNHMTDKVDVGAKGKGTFTLFISDGDMDQRLVLVIDAEKLTISATDNKYGWAKTGDEAGESIAIALMTGCAVSRLEWHGIDRITGYQRDLYYDETAEEWHSL